VPVSRCGMGPSRRRHPRRGGRRRPASRCGQMMAGPVAAERACPGRLRGAAVSQCGRSHRAKIGGRPVAASSAGLIGHVSHIESSVMATEFDRAAGKRRASRGSGGVGGAA
jgi:hypothetical protein